ncbi:MAG: TRAP transporter small permease [Betaproteobacteria bacterium]
MATNIDGAGSTPDREMAGLPSRAFAALLLALNSIGTLWIFVLMLVIMVDVFGRTALSRPLPGVAELVSLSIIGIVFLQIAHTLRSGRITRVDSLSDWLEGRWPRAGFILQGIYSLLGATLFAVLLIACQPLFVRAWTNDEYAGVEGYVTYPFWPIRLIMLIGCACSTLQYLMFAWQQFGRAAGKPAPVTGETA